MNVQKESQLGSHAIMWAVMNKPQEVKELGKRNGITFSYTTPNGLVPYTDLMTAQSLGSYMRKLPRVRQDFVTMMAQYPDWATSYMSMNGEFANVSGGVPFFNLNTSTPLDTGAINNNTPKKSWFTSDKIESTLNTALNAFLTLDKNKTDRALAGSASDVAMYNSQQGGGAIGGIPPTKKSNTTLYIILGVLGVALVGGLIYVATKKR